MTCCAAILEKNLKDIFSHAHVQQSHHHDDDTNKDDTYVHSNNKHSLLVRQLTQYPDLFVRLF